MEHPCAHSDHSCRGLAPGDRFVRCQFDPLALHLPDAEAHTKARILDACKSAADETSRRATHSFEVAPAKWLYALA